MTGADDQPQPILTLALRDEMATAAFAEDVAACLASGDVVALSGDLGSGKTTFARSLLRAVAGDPALEVPSPTFTLVQTYATRTLNVAHFDFYRLTGPADLDETGFGDAVTEGAALVEWPERAGDRLPPETLWIAFDVHGAGRKVVVSGGGSLAARLIRSRAIRAFLGRFGWHGASRQHLQGDASTRQYERVREGRRTAVLMDWPPGSQLPEGDPRVSFRARGVRAVVAVDRALREAGISAPEILAVDEVSGLLLMEDFGDEGLVMAGPDAARYRAVLEMLAVIHARPRSDELPFESGPRQRLPVLSGDALLTETISFVEWFVPAVIGRKLSPAATGEFEAIWLNLADRLSEAEQGWVLFDLQSSNLFWLPEREGIARIGVIDFQDMFVGPLAYDVASICLDARVTIPAAMERMLRNRYVELRRAVDPKFDEERFEAAYAISAASRIMKNLGAFSRLSSHGKPSYANHLPRSREYLARVLVAPVLSPLALWYERNLTP